MLRKIISIKNVGRFRSSASSPNPDFGRHTLIFGANGYGKSTLCAVLRSLSSADASVVTGRKTLGQAANPEIDLLFVAGNRRFQNGAWSAQEPLLSIFDSAFVAENVHSGDVVDITHKRSLYRVIIGRAGVGLAEREQALAEQARSKQAELTTAERAVDTLRPRHVPFANFLGLVEDPDIDVAVTAQQGLVTGLRQAEAIQTRPPISILPVPEFTVRINELLATSLDGVAAGVEGKIRAHLERHRMQDGGQRWLSEGLQFGPDDECPFCGRDGMAELGLVQAYRALFGEAYAGLRESIDGGKAEVDRILGDRARADMRTLLARNAAAQEFWERHCPLEGAGLASPDHALELLEVAHRGFAAALTRKAGAPLETITDDQNVNLATAALEDARIALAAYNRAVEAANQLIRAKKETTAEGDLAAAEQRLATLLATKLRHEPHVATACAAYQRLDGEKRQLETDKAAVRAQLEAHTQRVVRPYEGRINYFLDRFNAGFRIARAGHGYPGGVAASTYQISINNTGVDLGDGRTPGDRPSFKNTLSAGDRTTLALAFFLAGLEREPDLANRIVVFDDPFSSQDAFRRRQTIYEIMRVAGNCAQVVVLSHDPYFLKQLWEKCPQGQRVSLQILHHQSTGSKITTFNLDDACRGRARAELEDLMTFRSTGTGNPREIIKKLRIVIETHMRSAYPGAFDPNDNYGAILTKIRNGGDQHVAHDNYADLDRINDYTAEYHHGEDPRGAAEPPIDNDELTGFVTDTLRLANALPA